MRIIGIDGEGIGRSPHKYTLLAWSDAEGTATDYIEDLNGLSSLQCLAFLTSIPADCQPFGYFLGYDWTKIFQDIPNKSLFKLYRPEYRKVERDSGVNFAPICWKGYRIHYLAGMVEIARGKGRPVTFWDVGKFFQKRFDVALKGCGIEAGNIENMKAKRSTFKEGDFKAIREYCLFECRQLAKLVEHLNQSHDQAGLTLKTWYGPGSTASVMLRGMGIADLRGEQPEGVHDASSRAFFGGRFEHSTIGTVQGPISTADIISAYPAECVKLPCLHHGRWERTTHERDLDRARHACVEYRLERSTRAKRRAWGPLPCRLPDGTIVYPRHGTTGWAWLDEYRVARCWPQTKFVSAWLLHTDCDCQPFAKVEEAFYARLRAGKKSSIGQALKLAINSVYGKLAQSIGDPPFRSLIWAGMITSGTRAKLLEVLYRYDDAILSVATDGVTSRAPMALDYGERLGQWEAGQESSITLIRPGILWGDEIKSRGLPRASIEREQEAILTALNRGDVEHALVPIMQFGAARATVYLTPQGVKRSERYGEWFTRPAKVSFSPAPKRRPDWGLWEFSDMIASKPYTKGTNEERLGIDALMTEHLF